MKKRLTKGLRRGLALLLGVCLVSGGGIIPSAAEPETQRYTFELPPDADNNNDYEWYWSVYGGQEAGEKDQPFCIEEPTAGENIELREDLNGRDGKAVVTKGEGFAEWQVDVERAGLYELEVTYLPLEGNPTEIVRQLLIDGKIPFYEALFMTFPRQYKDKTAITTDQSGNDVTPSQVEEAVWRTIRLRDMTGNYDSPYQFYLTAGTHTFRFLSEEEPMAFGALSLVRPSVVLSYGETKQALETDALVDMEPQIYEAEKSYLKSSPMLCPIYDRSSPTTSPNSYRYLRLNTIGGDRWKYPGDSITWKIYAPEDGVYKIALKARQNLSSGAYSSRRLYIDGAVPFQEAANLQFQYSDDWQMIPLGNGEEEYLFYLTEGEHEICLEAILGDMKSVIAKVSQAVYENNEIYRQILMITGADPDLYRDYEIQKQLPHLTEELHQQQLLMQSAMEELLLYTGKRGSNFATLSRMEFRLSEMIRDPEKIPASFSDYKDCITSLGSWLLTAKEQPLELDYLVLYSRNEELPKASAGFFDALWYNVLAFFSSYFQTYNTLGNIYTSDNTLEVWIGSGRDQSTIIKKIIDEKFVPEYQIGVNLSLVSMSSLLPATLAGKGPDVALQISQTEIVNFAMRHAAVNLLDFDGYSQVAERFYPSALLPFQYEGGIYSLPETQTFPMLFYRKDILAELGITELNTWEDVYTAISIIQKKHMNLGLPATQTGYGMLLYQNGGGFYQENGKYSGMDTETGIAAFKQLTEFYTNYGSPQEYNFATRFRIGEIPIAIADISMYNLLSIYAPEIQGMWGILPIPGTEDAEENIDRSVPGTAAGAMILSAAANPESAWKFIDWWTSTEIQAEYGHELENVLGVAARHFTANKEAAQQIAWSQGELAAIQAQWEWVKEIPEVPGGYYTSRCLEYAFKAVVISRQAPRDALTDYVKSINRELHEKRREFGMDQ